MQLDGSQVELHGAVILPCHLCGKGILEKLLRLFFTIRTHGSFRAQRKKGVNAARDSQPPRECA